MEWLKREWLTFPAMLMEGALPNDFTINGRAYPATDTIRMRVGQTVKLRFIGSSNNFIHPMHVHGGPFTVVARDGEVLPEGARFEADTVNVGPGQRYGVIWTARRPGRWLVHCHIPHHTGEQQRYSPGRRWTDDGDRGRVKGPAAANSCLIAKPIAAQLHSSVLLDGDVDHATSSSRRPPS